MNKNIIFLLFFLFLHRRLFLFYNYPLLANRKTFNTKMLINVLNMGYKNLSSVNKYLKNLNLPRNCVKIFRLILKHDKILYQIIISLFRWVTTNSNYTKFVYMPRLIIKYRSLTTKLFDSKKHRSELFIDILSLFRISKLNMSNIPWNYPPFDRPSTSAIPPTRDTAVSSRSVARGRVHEYSIRVKSMSTFHVRLTKRSA